MARLKDVVHLTNGSAFDSDRFSDTDGVPLVRIRDLLAGETKTLYDGPVSPELLVHNDDLLVGMDGDFNSVVWSGGTAALNQRVCRLQAQSGVFQGYLRYLIDLPLRFINDLTYSTTVKHLSSVDLLDERIPMPTMKKQRAIAEFLDAETARIDALITKKRRMIDLLDERRMSVMSEGVRGVLTGADQTPAGVRWLPTRGSHWREAKLTLVATLGTGHTPSRDHPEWWVDCTVPWITTGEVAQMRTDRIEFIETTRESISQLGIENSSAVLHPVGTVVLCRTASAGYSAIMGRDMATSQDFVTWTCGPLLEPRFLLLSLRVMRKDLLGRLAMGSTHKTIYMPDIESLRVVLPPIGEQRRIVDVVWEHLASLHGLMDRTTRQLELLQEHRQALITAAVTGELQVPGVAA
jgi:type I restriction enzyme, S subunit